MFVCLVVFLFFVSAHQKVAFASAFGGFDCFSFLGTVVALAFHQPHQHPPLSLSSGLSRGAHFHLTWSLTEVPVTRVLFGGAFGGFCVNGFKGGGPERLEAGYFPPPALVLGRLERSMRGYRLRLSEHVVGYGPNAQHTVFSAQFTVWELKPPPARRLPRSQRGSYSPPQERSRRVPCTQRGGFAGEQCMSGASLFAIRCEQPFKYVSGMEHPGLPHQLPPGTYQDMVVFLVAW